MIRLSREEHPASRFRVGGSCSLVFGKGKEMTRIKNLVIKLGTSTLLKDGKFDQTVFEIVARQAGNLMKAGVSITVVSSGGVKAGREALAARKVNAPGLSKKDLAGIGARHLLGKWGDAFRAYVGEVAQVYVTYANWNDPEERGSILSALKSYHANCIVPIVNENDVVSPLEIDSMDAGFSENDKLARMVAELISADAILFLTSAGGVYEANPLNRPGARRYSELDVATALRIADEAAEKSPDGSGGISAKLKEAVACSQRGMIAAIAGVTERSIFEFVFEKEVGTRIGTTTRLVPAKS